MYQNIPTNVINYVDSEGNVVTNAIIKSIQIRSEDDIENDIIKNPTPGTRAYLPDESKVWIFGADEEWHLQAISNNGDSSQEDPSERALFLHVVAYDDEEYLDAKWNEIYQAMREGKVVYVVSSEEAENSPEVRPVLLVSKYSQEYFVMVGKRSSTTEDTSRILIDYYSCAGPTDNPSMERGVM